MKFCLAVWRESVSLSEKENQKGWTEGLNRQVKNNTGIYPMQSVSVGYYYCISIF